MTEWSPVTPPLSNGKQSVKEGAIALQRDAKILGGNIVAAIPLLLQLGTFFGKDFSQAFHR